jgi:hypothetical protein
MANLDGFDANQVEPASDFEPLPAGEYLAMAIDSEFKPTKNGSGEYLQFAFEIVDGAYRGRRLWDRLNLKNKNETTVKIAQGTLSAICRAVGVLRPKDSAEIHGKPLKIRVALEPRADRPGSFKNEIKGYASVNGASAPAAASANGDSGGSMPPWKRKSA